MHSKELKFDSFQDEAQNILANRGGNVDVLILAAEPRECEDTSQARVSYACVFREHCAGPTPHTQPLLEGELHDRNKSVQVPPIWPQRWTREHSRFGKDDSALTLLRVWRRF